MVEKLPLGKKYGPVESYLLWNICYSRTSSIFQDIKDENYQNIINATVV